jgi:hypothetical protein
MKQLAFEKVICASTGRPLYNPKDLLKCISMDILTGYDPLAGWNMNLQGILKSFGFKEIKARF